LVSEAQLPVIIRDADEFKAKMEDSKEDDLSRISDYLGLKHPSDIMIEIYDSVVRVCASIMTEKSEIKIYYDGDLKRKLKRGATIEGFTYLRERDEFHFTFNSSLTGSEKGMLSEGISMLPVILKPKDLKDGGSRMAVFLDMVEILRTVSGIGENSIMSPHFLTLHETIEAEIIFSMIKSPDRRWFADGMANAISLLVLGDRHPDETLDQLLETYYNPSINLLDVMPSVDLIAWEASENETREYPNNEYYYLATYAVLEMIKENGEDFLPKLFKKLRKYDYEEADMDIVYKIFRKITGNDMKSYIHKAKQSILDKHEEEPD